MRPKTIKFGSGEITFKNIDIEERNEIIEKIKGPKMVVEWDEENQEYKLVPEVVNKEEQEEVKVEKVLPHTGYSFIQVGNMWSAVEIKLNTDTKEAEVVNITPLHTNRNVASDKFRVKFSKYWF